MIRSIVAIDHERGLANEAGIPWQGKLAGDSAYYQDHIRGQAVLMGFTTYQEMGGKVATSGPNYVLTSHPEKVGEACQAVSSLDFLKQITTDIWVIGGSGVYAAAALPYVSELYITQLEGSYGCSKFFPAYDGRFTMATTSDTFTENGIRYRFEVWRRV